MLTHQSHWAVRRAASCLPEVYRGLFWNRATLQRLGMLPAVARAYWQMQEDATTGNASTSDAAVYC
eukprot:13654901-Alexandrium_andersonii.AAC.1